MQKRIVGDDILRSLAPASGPAPGLLADENAVGHLHRWAAQGRRTALVTLVGVTGGAPRQPGAQMAVAEDGQFAGYLSGGCLEQAIVLEALDVIAKGENRLVRYGQGSPYLDIRLPCGSGLDVYFDQGLTSQHRAALAFHQTRRAPMLLRTDLVTGASTVSFACARAGLDANRRVGDLFERYYPPALQVLLAGSGPTLAGLAALSAAIGLSLLIAPTDEATRAQLIRDGLGAGLVEDGLAGAVSRLDFASAAIVVMHDHAHEPELIKTLLATDCFYIGALGNPAVHRARVAALAELGVGAAECDRLRAPMGAIPGAKSKATLAIGVLMEMMADAKARHLVA